jgi:hypothetical protein
MILEVVIGFKSPTWRITQRPAHMAITAISNGVILVRT